MRSEGRKRGENSRVWKTFLSVIHRSIEATVYRVNLFLYSRGYLSLQLLLIP
jgi:hypothetical protein